MYYSTLQLHFSITPCLIFAIEYVSFATTFLYQVASTCYLQKKLISNTAFRSGGFGIRSIRNLVSS